MYGSKYGTGTIFEDDESEINAIYGLSDVDAPTTGPANPYSVNHRWLGLNFIVCDISGHTEDVATDVLFVPF